MLLHWPGLETPGELCRPPLLPSTVVPWGCVSTDPAQQPRSSPNWGPQDGVGTRLCKPGCLPGTALWQHQGLLLPPYLATCVRLWGQLPWHPARGLCTSSEVVLTQQGSSQAQGHVEWQDLQESWSRAWLTLQGLGYAVQGGAGKSLETLKRLCQRLHKSHQTPLARTSWATMAAFGSQNRLILNKDKVDLCIRFWTVVLEKTLESPLDWKKI